MNRKYFDSHFTLVQSNFIVLTSMGKKEKRINTWSICNYLSLAHLSVLEESFAKDIHN